MKILYLELHNSGISGDMLLASLLGIVPEPELVLEELCKLKDYLSGVSQLNIRLIKLPRSGIQLNQLHIEIKENRDHRSAETLVNSLNKYLNDNSFSNSAQRFANDVLNSLIQAEAEVHGKLASKVHLHELSSIDTLIDILGVTSVLDKLNAFDKEFKFYCSKIPLGGGTIKTAHGILSVPAPATLKILERSNLITFGGPIESELVTPTGIALLANLKPEFLEFPPEMTIKQSVYSTGQKKFKEFQNILRLFYGEYSEIKPYNSTHPLRKYVEKVSILETNVDDVSGEIIGNFFNEFNNEKVLDLQVIPSFSKKNRPSYAIKVLCYPKDTFELIEKMIHELGTLGVRYCINNRVCIDRIIEKKVIEIESKEYEVNFKISYISLENGKEIVNIKPEYEDIKKISEKSGIPARRIQFILNAKLNELYY
ncbi:MAG: nickel pincer cofactor biosynthesis protein LarC [Candidatus Lokiarchaeota archaeon]|nr:nickel pincer cofactor biosynthesis protein LarC [Candidatus Lokiarchaeota archaeon]